MRAIGVLVLLSLAASCKARSWDAGAGILDSDEGSARRYICGSRVTPDMEEVHLDGLKSQGELKMQDGSRDYAIVIDATQKASNTWQSEKVGDGLADFRLTIRRHRDGRVEDLVSQADARGTFASGMSLGYAAGAVSLSPVPDSQYFTGLLTIESTLQEEPIVCRLLFANST